MRLDALVGGSAEVIGPEATLEEAAAAMIESDTGCLAVIDRRDLVGLITERDLVRALAAGTDAADELVEDWMSESPDVFAPDVLVTEAAEWLLETGYRHMPVVADGELLGVAGIRDILWAIRQQA